MPPEADISELAAPPLRLGVLDVCALRPGKSAADVIFETIDLVSHVERLGYLRYWLAEHHGPDIAHSSPEVLLPELAGVTQRIRVGSAGVLIRYHSALKTADNYRLLELLFPGRIDLGIALAPTDPAFGERLSGGPPGGLAPEALAERVEHLAAYARGQSPGAGVHATPALSRAPEVWMLGSGGSASATLGGRLAMSYSLSLFLRTSQDDPSIIERYREAFQPGPFQPEPAWNVAVAGICADSDERAQRLLRHHDNPFIVPRVVGSVEQCKAALEDIRRRYQTAEIIFLDLCADHRDRERSYALLAEAFELAPPGGAEEARAASA